MDFPTVARMWRFLRDAHFLDANSEAIGFKVAALNTQARILSSWNMRLSILPSGRLQSHATVLNAPILFLGATSTQDMFEFSMYMLLLLLSLAHTIVATGLPQMPAKSEGARTTTAALLEGSTADPRPSKWFRVLCQLSFCGLAITTLLGLYWNVATVRQVTPFSMNSSKGDASVEHLTVNMYHNLLAPARMLLPAKTTESVSRLGEGTCSVAANGEGQTPLEVAVGDSNIPLWARENADNGALDTFAALLVCTTPVRYCCGSLQLMLS